MSSTNVRAGGIDLDHQDSRAAGAASGTCAHDDFRSADGGRGVDLGERSMLRPSLRAEVERDAVRVF